MSFAYAASLALDPDHLFPPLANNATFSDSDSNSHQASTPDAEHKNDECPIKLAFQTDFGPESLTKYLRSEFERSRPSKVLGKRQGKTNGKTSADSEKRSAAKYVIGQQSDVHPKPSTAHPANGSSSSEASQTSTLSPGQARRRSGRIARQVPNNDEPLTHPSQSDGKSAYSPCSSRRTTFEEHTKTNRKVARESALNSSNDQEEARVQKTESSTTRTSTTPSPRHAGLQSAAVSSLDGHGPDTTPSAMKEDTPNKSDSMTQPERNAEVEYVEQLHVSTQASVMESNLSTPIPAFDYGLIVPEHIPPIFKNNFLDANRQHLQNESSASQKTADAQEHGEKISNTDKNNTEPSKALFPKEFPRIWKASLPPGMYFPKIKATKPRRSKSSSSHITPNTESQHLDADTWREISRFLSSEDVKNLRLVNKEFAEVMAPIQFRNIVLNFGKGLFDITGSDWDNKTGRPPSESMFKRFGSNINELGIGFEYDIHGLAYASEKVIEQEQVAWFGKFKWPTEQYPRFAKLQGMEDLVDHNRPLLKEALEHVTKASELGLCIDSGHGWLEGPDISDLALFNRRVYKGGKIFGKTFKAEDVWTTFAREEYFKWAQRNTVNESMKYFLEHASPEEVTAAKALRHFDAAKIHDMDTFRRRNDNSGPDSPSHVGGSSDDNADEEADNTGFLAFLHPPNAGVHPRHVIQIRPNVRKRKPRWPLIFNGHNVAPGFGGECRFVQSKTGDPLESPLKPAELSEAQAQWLLETLWAQRAFLSSYTTAIIANKQNFTGIHTLRITKLSSGLLPCLEQREFWDALPGLKRLQLLLVPDWRREHNIGDKSFVTNMLISPAQAAQKFTNFLRVHIVRIESLYSLTIGYAAGGEHAVGIFARNQHVLPAPIVYEPSEWLLDPSNRKQVPHMTKFDHIRDLRFENCWFTPWMLESFMKKSRDTSLHSLTLDSVSMVTYHDASLDKRLTTSTGNLQCKYDRGDWTREKLPSGAAWAKVLDAITPGTTLLEHKYRAGEIDPDAHPPPTKSFRGHIQRIILNSCGYVEITVPKRMASRFNQRALLTPVHLRGSGCLYPRKERFMRNIYKNDDSLPQVTLGPNGMVIPVDRESSATCIMMSTTSPSGLPYPWLGALTQCVHPIEKRVLEEAWGMRFGWGNSLARFAAVEDGQREGGTGRFSGMILKTADMEE